VFGNRCVSADGFRPPLHRMPLHAKGSAMVARAPCQELTPPGKCEQRCKPTSDKTNNLYKRLEKSDALLCAFRVAPERESLLRSACEFFVGVSWTPNREQWSKARKLQRFSRGSAAGNSMAPSAQRWGDREPRARALGFARHHLRGHEAFACGREQPTASRELQTAMHDPLTHTRRLSRRLRSRRAPKSVPVGAIARASTTLQRVA